MVFSGEDGIRTHAPVKTNGFQDRPVMTTSVPLHILFVMSALLLIADDLFIISPHLLLVNNFFRFFQLFYLSAVFLLSHRLFTLFLRILCFLFILRLSPLFALFCFQYTGQFICRLSKMYFHLKYPAETVLILSLFRRIFYSNTVRTARLTRSYISCLFPALLPQALCIRTNPFCIPDF